MIPLYSEKLVQNEIAKNPKVFLNENLTHLHSEKYVGKRFYLDLVFKDKNGYTVIVEVQIGDLNRNHLYRSLEYRDALVIEEKIKKVRSILFVEEVSDLYRKICKVHNIKLITMPRKEIISKMPYKSVKFPSKIETTHDNSWSEVFNSLQSFVEKNKKLPIRNASKNTPTNLEKKLSTWLKSQNYLFWENKLSKERETLIKNLNFEFIDNRKENPKKRWPRMCALLKDFIQNNNGRMPDTKEIYKGDRLGSWLSRQRCMAKKGKLEKKEVGKLKQIGVSFKHQGTSHGVWLETFVLFLEYIELYGQLRHTKIMYKGRALGKWLARQVRNAKKRELFEYQLKIFHELGLFHEFKKFRENQYPIDISPVLGEIKDRNLDFNVKSNRYRVSVKNFKSKREQVKNFIENYGHPLSSIK